MTIFDSVMLIAAVAISCLALATGLCLIAFGICYSLLSWIEHRWPYDSRIYNCTLLIVLGFAVAFVGFVAQIVITIYQYELHRSII